jgi:hypothetical protein
MPSKAYYQAHRELLTEQERQRYYARAGKAAPPKHIPKPKPPPVENTPIADVPDGHPLYEEARKALRPYELNDLGSDMDYRSKDLLQEYVLAVLEGRSPEEAVRVFRAARNHDRKELVYGLSIVDGLDR